MNKIIVTGSTGFVGKNLANYFQNSNNIETMPLDLHETLDIKMFTGGTTIIHLAGKAHDLKKNSNPNEYYQVNFELTKKLYDVFLQSGVAKFIFISSVKAAADSVDGVLTEDIDPEPMTDYGKSKLMAEQYIQQQPLPDGKSFYILRPCMIHGPGNKGNLNLLYKFVKKGVPYPLAAFDNQRSFLNIQNLCFVINELLTAGNIANGIYQVADDEALSTNKVVSILASSLNVKPRLWKVSKKFITLIAKIGDRLHLPLTTERLKKLTESYIVSNEKIKKAIGKKLPFSAAEGLTITADSFNKN